MPLKTLVKASNISNLSDARYCAGMGVEMLGFRVIPGQENYMAPTVFQDIRGWISGPKIIAELYGVSNAEEIEFVLKTYAPDYLEVTYEQYNLFNKSLALPCIVFVPSGSFHKMPDTGRGQIKYLLTEEKTTCKEVTDAYPTLIKISSLENLQEKIKDGCFTGFALQGSAESRPGVTSYDQLGEILEALEAD